MNPNDEINTLKDKVTLLEEKVEKIRLVNKFNVIQKNWESSKTRVFYVATSTYLFSAIFLFFLNATNPLLSAFVPFFGVLLSFPSIPFVKSMWVKNYLKSEKSHKETGAVNLQQESKNKRSIVA
jgi:hypothetical protein